jgi:hypothetical protein
MGTDTAAVAAGVVDGGAVDVADEDSVDDEARASNTHVHAVTVHELEG